MANTVRALESEWARYKYWILEKSPEIYRSIRELLRDKSGEHTERFYALIREALLLETTDGNFINAAQHVWGYFKKCATEQEKQCFLRQVGLLEAQMATKDDIRRLLKGYATKYRQEYVLHSYFVSPPAAASGPHHGGEGNCV